MEDRIKTKRVGKVNICEVFGSFRDGFAWRGKADMAQMAQRQQAKAPDLLLNVKGLTDIDDFGTEVLLETAQSFHRSALLSDRSRLAGKLDFVRLGRKFQVMTHPAEAATSFAHEFVDLPAELPEGEERRGLVRLKTALAVQFSPHDKTVEAPLYFAVVTNLCENGLYAEFIDSETESFAVKNLDPMELKLLDVKIILPKLVSVEAQAKVIHVKKGEGGIGMEFYHFAGGDRQKLGDWLAQSFIANSQIQGGVYNEKI